MKKTKMLKKNYEFKDVLRRGKYYSGTYLEAFLKKNKNNKEINFLGIAIGVKIAKAVERNRIKRLIRENYSIIEDNLITGYSIIFLCKKNVNINEISFKSVKKDLNKIFLKSKILEEKI